jgi:hypothetical protein
MPQETFPLPADDSWTLAPSSYGSHETEDFLRGRLLKLYYFPTSPHCLKVRAVGYALDVHL